MKKTLIIIIAIFFTTSVYASHGNWTCTNAIMYAAEPSITITLD